MTNRTLDRGSKLSPDYVCTPFKGTLGSMIDGLEVGANTLVMTMGVCRLGYYGELQEQILHDMGYEFDFINLSEYSTGKQRDVFRAFKRINPKYSLPKATKTFLDALKMVEYMDECEEIYYKNCGFEVNKGSYKKVYNRFLSAMDTATSRGDIEAGYKAFKRQIREIPLDKPDHPLRVGVVGEYFTVMDPFSNLEVQQKLCNMGVETYRYINVTHRNIHYNKAKNLRVGMEDYFKYEMGPTSTMNIWAAKDYAEKGFDGVIHIKSAGCTPEIDIMPVLQNISADYKMPILYLTYDTQTSDTGLDTRLEAFYDMISMRKKVI